VFSGSYLFRIPRSAWRLSGLWRESDSAGGSSNTDVVGKGNIFGGWRAL